MDARLSSLRQRFSPSAMQRKASERLRPSGWVLPLEDNTLADPGTWSNKDSDVTPPERRTWTSWTILGFWMSDALNAQGWEAPSSIIATGLTWREAIYCNVFGLSMDAIPLVLNGVIGADLHVPFPIAIRPSFGFYLSRFAITTRLITALFWHAIQSWTGSLAMFQMIRAIWPSFRDLPNGLPASAGLTTAQMVSHLVFFLVQLPLLLTPPHKLKWFFIFKTVVVLTVSVAVVIAMTHMAGGIGPIFNQEYKLPPGNDRNWAIMSAISSMAGGWATMATNIPDFTRYMKTPKGVYWQALFLPLITSVLALFGILSTSSARVVYGEYLWSPISLADKWEGPAGRCGAFFVGFCWVVAQIGTNLSANVISAANDLTGLFPKYVNIRRGVVIITFTGCWVMAPWKIVDSAESLLTFMAGLSTFLAPIAAILAADYWVVRRRRYDVPAMYRRNGRYRYNVVGSNWRAAVAFLISVTPNMPGLAKSVNPSINLDAGIEHVWNINYLWGCSSAFVVYWALSVIFPPTETFVPETVYGDVAYLDAAPVEEIDGDFAEKNMGQEVKVTSAKKMSV